MPFGTSTRLYSLLAERINFPIRNEKRSDTIVSKPLTSKCVKQPILIQYAYTPLKSAYSLLKMRTAKKRLEEFSSSSLFVDI